MDLIKATKYNMKPEEWSSEPDSTSGKRAFHFPKFSLKLMFWSTCLTPSSPETQALISARPTTVTMQSDEGANVTVAVYNLLGKLQLSFLYLIRLIMMGFEHMRNIARVMKPVRVAAIES
jgi:hypothetical protein